MARAYVSLGSNLDPEANLLRALRLLGQSVRLVALSTVYRTPAEGRPEQPDFYNAVLAIETGLPPRALKYEVLRAVEAALGRRRGPDRYAARPIDLDLLLYDEVVLEEEGLTLPDPDLTRRPFLARPLHELAPTLVLPGSGVKLQEVIDHLSSEDMHALAHFTARAREEVVHEP